MSKSYGRFLGELYDKKQSLWQQEKSLKGVWENALEASSVFSNIKACQCGARDLD